MDKSARINRIKDLSDEDIEDLLDALCDNYLRIIRLNGKITLMDFTPSFFVKEDNVKLATQGGKRL